jgi:hypothetical protein
MGMLDDMERDLMAVTRPAPVVIQISEPEPEPEDTRLLDALTAIREQIAAIEMPELKLDLEKAVKQLVTGLARIKTEPKLPEPLDLAPLVKAVEGITLMVNIPEEKESKPEPVYFDIERDSSGRMSRVIATPGIAPPQVTSYEME